MDFFHYNIAKDEIKEFTGTFEAVPSDFLEYETTLVGHLKVYYRIRNGKITEAIGEAMTEDAARRRVDDVLSALNVNLI